MGDDGGNARDKHYAMKLLERSAQLGNMNANYCLGGVYYLGEYVKKDVTKAVCYMEKAAITGDSEANYALAFMERTRGNIARAVELFITAAGCGEEEALDRLDKEIKEGNATQEDKYLAMEAYARYIEKFTNEQQHDGEGDEEGQFELRKPTIDTVE